MIPDNIMEIIPSVRRATLPLLNLVGKKNTVKITVTAPGYIEIRLLFGLIVIERGEKRVFEIKGTEAYVRAITSLINKQGLETQKNLLPY